MTDLNLRKLLDLTIQELDGLRERYEALSRSAGDTRLAMLAGYLARREAGTIAAITRYCERDEHRAALDVHVRLSWGYPFADKLEWPHEPSVDELVELADKSDDQLAQLSERVELYASGAELHESLAALDAIIKTRRQELASASRELEEVPGQEPKLAGSY